MRHPRISRGLVFGLLFSALALGAWAALRVNAVDEDRGRPPAVSGRVRPAAYRQLPKPTLDGGTAWINSAGPIRLEELRGKVVLLDFWTYCCINCHHVLPDLARLEQKYKNELVVIGIHTPKFPAEQITANIREKVREYQIKHPVINDADQILWNRFGVNSWPTLVLIDPAGNVIGGLAGEGHFAELDRAIGKLVEIHRARGDLNETPLKFFPENEKPDDTPLLFPGKVLADTAGGRLFIADTAHNRIVVSDLDGKLRDVIGDGGPGLADGSYARAQFQRPQGMCLVGDHRLFVADTENHALREVNLADKTVATVAGNGRQSHQRAGSGPAKRAALNSPWDIVQWPGRDVLLIAMAGPHQIWEYDIDKDRIGVWAGTGSEQITDGPLAEADFAQPSGLATDGTHLYVADSEVSAIRMINLKAPSPVVRTIVGAGLFEFADIDGRGNQVRLQHCLGVAWGGTRLYIADTYNNKVKACDPKTRSVNTLLGSGKPGDTDKPPRFYQPGGLSAAGSRLYVADTNNHKIRRADLDSGKLETIEIAGLRPPAPKHRTPTFPNATVVEVETKRVAPSGSFTFDVTLPIPAGLKLNKDVPLPYLLETPGHSGILSDDFPPSGRKVESPARKLTITVPLAGPPRDGEEVRFRLSLSAFVCSEASSLCTIRSYVWNVPVVFAKGESERIDLAGKAP